MATRLEMAFAEAARLSPEEQDVLAEKILAELDLDNAFDRVVTESADTLLRLAEEALAEHRAGKTQNLN